MPLNLLFIDSYNCYWPDMPQTAQTINKSNSLNWYDESLTWGWQTCYSKFSWLNLQHMAVSRLYGFTSCNLTMKCLSPATSIPHSQYDNWLSILLINQFIISHASARWQTLPSLLHHPSRRTGSQPSDMDCHSWMWSSPWVVAPGQGCCKSNIHII